MNEKIIARFNEEKAQREYEINCTNQLVKKVEDFCANLAEKMLTARNLEPSSSMKAEFAEFKTQLKNQMENALNEMVQKIDNVLINNQNIEPTGRSTILKSVTRPKTEQMTKSANVRDKKRKVVFSKKKSAPQTAISKTQREPENKKKLSKFEQVYRELSPKI